MTMHAVLGDGEMTRRELTETLADLWKADEENQQSFWFLLQGKSEPTDTDKAMVTWMEKNDIYYELVTDDADAISEIYTQPQETHIAKKLAQKVVSLLQSKPEEGEPAEVLALFFDVNEATAPEDRWLNSVITSASDAGYPTRALNDGLVDVDLSESAAAAEEEPEEAAPVKKATAKKVAAPRPAADIPISAEDDSETPPALETPSRAELENMEPAQVKALAAEMGIVLAPRTRATTYIDHILGENRVAAPTVVVEEPELDALANGWVDADVIAEKVTDLLWERIQKALANV